MFQGISTALTALYAGRAALETTGNNIANVNTEGYSRQRVSQTALGGSPVPAFFSTSNGVGVGVNLDQIERLRDQFLEARGLTEHSTQAFMTRSADTYSNIELAFGEPSDTSLQSQLSDYWAAWDDLANSPGDLAARSQVIEQSKTLVSAFHQADESLDSLKDASLTALKGDVSKINTMAKSIADLNRAVQSAVNSGDSPNALLDQRDLLVSKMADLAGIRVEPTSSGSIAVSINGVAIVRDDRVNTLVVDDTASPVAMRWDTDGDTTTLTDSFPARVNDGEIGSLLEGINTTIPKYQTLLDNVASKLITMINTQHASGNDKYGNPGVALFTGTTAADIDLNPAVDGDSNLLAAAQTGGGALDAENARAIANFSIAIDNPDAAYRQLIDVLGAEGQRASRQLEIQSGITASVDGAREASAGVNLDEEMANLVRFQKSYTSAAKYLSVINETLDTLFGMVR